MRVFIVEDSTLVVNRLRSVLATIKGMDYIGSSGNARSAVDSIRALKPDIVILDIRLDGGTGLDVLKLTRKDLPSTKVVVLTNYPYPQYRKRSTELGAQFFLDKVTEINRVMEVLQELGGGNGDETQEMSEERTSEK